MVGNSNYLWNVSYYDNRGRAVKNVSQHYKGAGTRTNNYDEITNVYNFAGELKSSVRRHYLLGVESLYVRNDFSYDHMGRAVDTYQKTGNTSATTANSSVLLSRLVYNEVGQLKNKSLHSTNFGSSFVHPLSYTFNERGWLSSQSSTLFTQELKYNEAVSGVTPQYNGNIERQEWTGGKYYNYVYDGLNRLTSAIANTGNNEELSNDKMGNILTLQRKLSTAFVDQLSYT